MIISYHHGVIRNDTMHYFIVIYNVFLSFLNCVWFMNQVFVFSLKKNDVWSNYSCLICWRNLENHLAKEKTEMIRRILLPYLPNKRRGTDRLGKVQVMSGG